MTTVWRNAPCMTDQESAEYWKSHELTEDFLLYARPLEYSEMLPKRTDAKTITIRMEIDTLEGLQELAERNTRDIQIC